MVWIGGFTPQATISAIYGATFLTVMQHVTIKTPQWVGFIFQHREFQSLHHTKGMHAFDYSDLPIFDSIRGTFQNPKEFVTETGLYDGASSKIKQMILFKGTNNEVT